MDTNSAFVWERKEVGGMSQSCPPTRSKTQPIHRNFYRHHRRMISTRAEMISRAFGMIYETSETILSGDFIHPAKHSVPKQCARQCFLYGLVLHKSRHVPLQTMSVLDTILIAYRLGFIKLPNGKGIFLSDLLTLSIEQLLPFNPQDSSLTYIRPTQKLSFHASMLEPRYHANVIFKGKSTSVTGQLTPFCL